MGIDTHYTNNMLQRVPKSSQQLVREQGGGSTGSFAFDDQSNNPLAVRAASQGQGFGNEMSAVDMGLSQHEALRAWVDRLQAQRDRILGGGAGPPKPSGFGFNMPTLGAVGDIFGGAGKVMTGLGSLRVADTARDSYEEKKKYNALNWGQQLAKRAGEVSGENAMRMDDNSYRTAQGIGHLAEMIPA